MVNYLPSKQRIRVRFPLPAFILSSGERGFEPLTCGFGNRCSTIGTILLRNEEALLGLFFLLKLSIPYGDRTRVTALKKRCPNH